MVNSSFLDRLSVWTSLKGSVLVSRIAAIDSGSLNCFMNCTVRLLSLHSDTEKAPFNVLSFKNSFIASSSA